MVEHYVLTSPCIGVRALSAALTASVVLISTTCRLKLGIRPGRYGNIDGTKRIYYDNLARLEGVD